MNDPSEPGRQSAAIERILAWDRMLRSPRSSALLRYIAEHTLSGDHNRLKAFSIAQDVFGRTSDFDADTDPLVRVQSGRLRALLESYALSEGKAEEIEVSLPRGGYTLSFRQRQPSAFATLPETPVLEPVATTAPFARAVARNGSRASTLRHPLLALAVSMGLILAISLTLANLMTHWNTRGGADARPTLIRLLVPPGGPNVTERALSLVVQAIARRFSEFETVIRAEADDHKYQKWPEDYRIVFKEAEGAGAHVMLLSVVHLATGTIVDNAYLKFQGQMQAEATLLLERALMSSLQIGGPVVADYERRERFTPVMKCVLASEQYFKLQTNEKHLAARTCAHDAIASGIDNAALHIVLAYMHREEFTDRRNLLPGNALERAKQAAARATEREPTNARAHYALVGIYALTGDFQLMEDAGKKAIASNPSDADILAGYATRLVYRGKFSEALTLLESAERLRPTAPRWRSHAFFLAKLGLGRTTEALDHTGALRGTTNPLYLAALAITAGQKGDLAEMAELLALVNRYERGFDENPRAMYERRLYDAALIDRLVGLLKFPS